MSDEAAELEKVKRLLAATLAENERLRTNQSSDNSGTSGGQKPAKRRKRLTEAMLPKDKRLDRTKKSSAVLFIRQSLFLSYKFVRDDDGKEAAIRRIFKRLQLKTTHDQERYRDHINLILRSKIREHRDNCIGRVKKAYLNKSWTGCKSSSLVIFDNIC